MCVTQPVVKGNYIEHTYIKGMTVPQILPFETKSELMLISAKLIQYV